ncbi:MAG: nitrilase-related carbon-nitrogen hydrolase [Candidatus Hydrothermarchaeales archaeon]
MKIDLAQIDIKLGIKDKNLARAIGIIQGSQADLILFPELFTTGFDFDNLSQLSERVPGETTERIAAICDGTLFGGTILEKDGNKIYNTFVLINEDGVMVKYRKIHPFREEKKHFNSGRELKVIETNFGRVALATCFDVRFPELFKEFMRRMADIVLVSAEFPDPREDHWKTLLRARAIENQCFVIATNRVGKDAKQTYFGGSIVIDPWGEIVVSGGREESILKAEVDITKVAEVRSSFPVLDDALDDYRKL